MSDELKREGDGAKGEADPSMEDILASIRRIIAEDGEARDTAAAETTDSVLELTEMVADDGSVVSLPPHGAGTPAPAEEAVAEAPEPPPAEPAPAPMVEEDAAPPIEPDPSPLDNFAEPAEMPPAEEPREDPEMPSDASPTEQLVSAPVANQARNAFAQLEDAARPAPPPPPVSGDGRTVEQMAEDLMRPMLKAWLDANLPALVERAVAQELARITGRGSK
ncbi:DUF2497 domain-containing protein [Zavarzinia compransoris]|uniref:DUF2497 domain-containing protein n=1 Tax=Zavarzinia marina TaxID=2911065 RepID=UPI001F2C9FC8|nr:DUF2497 domain-containing protein [Zavarzinia marina]MCF4165039.1 DUF2497 domain-containing protein [Zavarzinia marina]